MKNKFRVLLVVLASVFVLSLLAACTKDPDSETCTHTYVNGVCSKCNAQYEIVDYAGELKLDMNSSTAKYTATDIVRMYIDGDTTHFNVPTTINEDGVLKARYLAVNTPESTGQIEPYGKKASNYTHETLQAAIDNGGSVLVESDTDDNVWNYDSYGRYLVWVWYKPSADADWRNLNLELLQYGYGRGSDVESNRYGTYCKQAMNQAISAGLIVYSNVADPDYYYGDAQQVTIRELRTHPEDYNGVTVSFEGIVTQCSDGSSYLQSFDETDQIWYGISVYYNGSNSYIKRAIFTEGNRVRIVGKVSEFNGTWQVSSLSYNPSDPDDADNVLNYGQEDITLSEITIEQFNSAKTVLVHDNESDTDEEQAFTLCQLIMDTSVVMKNLKVVDAYTTTSGSSKGAISLYCKDEDGNEITVRTEVLYKLDENGNYVTVTEDEFLNKTITVTALVDYYNYNEHNEYQLRLVSYDFVTISE